MERVVDIVRMSDYCPVCKSKYTVELYDVYGNPLGLTRLLNRSLLQDIDAKKLSHMECKICKTQFKILHYNGTIMPLNEDLNIDYENFKKDIEKRKDNLYGRYLFHGTNR